MSDYPDIASFLPLLVYFGGVVLLVVVILGLSYILGEKQKGLSRQEPYESGIKTTGSARLRFSSNFYLIAIFFVIFDLEAAFLIAWAIAFEGVGWFGYVTALVFILVLGVVLVYEWKMGALDFGPQGKKILKAYHRKFS